jgi:hypothetical protein
MARTFEELSALHRKDPFPFPMPGGAVIMIAQPSIRKDSAATAAAVAAGNVADGLVAGLRVYVADADGNDASGYGDMIAEAWGGLPAVALQDAVTDMRNYFVTPNEDA